MRCLLILVSPVKSWDMDIDIGIKAGIYQPKRQYYQHRFTVVSDRTAVFFCSTEFTLFRFVSTNKNTKSSKGVSGQERIGSFFVALKRNQLFCGGRSPPSILKFKKFQNGGNNMKGHHPKRRKDKYNPYSINEEGGCYYITFKDGQGIFHKLEISRRLYDAFNAFELDDLTYLNVWDRHMEHSEVWESTLNVRALHKPEGIEETVLNRIQMKELHRAVQSLPEMQKRRLLLYYFEDLTYEQIAEMEGCSKTAVKYTVDNALKFLK